jgi:DNA-3-methyladenine glycosylase
MDREFYARDPAGVARDLLGCVLHRRDGDRTYRARIVETEAYYASGDPASRARNGRKNYNAPMFDGPGHLFVYNVHRYWMLNFTTEPASAVLLRAVEPLNFSANTSGPGRLTRELGVDKSLNGKPLCEETGVWVGPGERPGRVALSHRIGVTRDLEEPLRFFVPGSEWVSAPRRPLRVEGFTR